ncbi:rRNA maturation RNase YbeY [Spiroplasma endosymbiont of Othius punctulatus]|uniref:rRNA maturation RNase YbeY n=1 Tax=Spiroplasma endosymbiont of Othius punctulatus TaxID=3066289 RepID=UPI0030CFC803
MVNFFNKHPNEELIGEYGNLFNKLFIHTKEILKIDYDLEMSVTFLTNKESIEMNKEYRDKDKIGDVLSFPIEMDDFLYEQTGYREIGDLFIASDEAVNKAKLYDHELDVEMAWLFVHGMLHLLGYDHELGDKEEQEMFQLTDLILSKINMKYNISNVIGD